MLEKMAWLPPFQLKRHIKAKNVSLRFSDKPELIITMPSRFKEKYLASILLEHRQWITEKWRTLPDRSNLNLPARIELKAINQIWTIEYCQTKQNAILMERAHLRQLVILGNVNDREHCFNLLRKWTLKKAKLILPESLSQLSKLTLLGYTQVSVRNQKSRWGSCTSKKSINLNFKLVLMPKELMEYVLIHELAHTVHMNHSKDFWRLVGSHCHYWQDAVQAFKKIDQVLPQWI